MRLLFFFCSICLGISLQNCSAPSSALTNNKVLTDTSLLGNFTDDYDIQYTVTKNSFIQHPGAKYNLILYNKKEQYLIAQNDKDNISGAGLFSRIDIIQFSNMEPWRWGFCLTAYKAPDKETATNTPAADRQNPKKGCAGYPFSRMKRAK
ncbi:MAG TPA: hypothetical protein PK504_10280 [Ferruginibacter sp.]|nr:hypothetical protein [Ferruginibacter sp.]HRE64883.1 hypothetical protein [Ferruginibacter sp.]